MSAPTINVALTVPQTEAEGPGVRFAIWVQGCPLRCPGCCNPEMLDAAEERTQMTAAELLTQVLASEGEGISLLGGEPFAQADGLCALAEGVQAAGRSVMVYSGYLLTQLKRRAVHEQGVRRLLAATDLLVDGPYIERERTTTRRFIGSNNQGLHFLTNFYRPDDPRLAAPNTVEIRLRGGVLTLNGYPVLGARTKITGVGQ